LILASILASARLSLSDVSHDSNTSTPFPVE
jgi:hypothetical protein